MQQAIIWLKKPIRVAGDEISILIADVITAENDEVVCKLGSGDTLQTRFDTMIDGNDVTPILCLVKNGDGGYINGVSDIRVIPQEVIDAALSQDDPQ